MTVTLIAGAGYLGSRLAERFSARGDTVFAIRRGNSDAFESPVNPGITWLSADLSDLDSRVLDHLRDTEVDRMIVSIAPGASITQSCVDRQSDSDDRATNASSTNPPDLASASLAAASISTASLAGATPADPFLAAIKGAVRLARALKIPRVLYTSSTGVYAESDGGFVDETSELVSPGATTSRSETKSLSRVARLLLAERIVREAMPHASIIARLSGLYGPGRNPVSRYEGAGDSAAERWTNRIHVEDAVSAIVLLVETPRVEVVNITDDAPAQVAEILKWIHERRKGTDSATPTLPHDAPLPLRGRASSSRRISNARLRALGWTPCYPSYREGFAALL